VDKRGRETEAARRSRCGLVLEQVSKTTRMSAATGHGLTSAEVAERIRSGQVNRSPRSEWIAYSRIVLRNLVTVFNLIVVPAAIALFYFHDVYAGLAVSGMAIVNSALGLVQEVRAKRHLDRLMILVEARARVVRDGRVHEVPAGEVVLGDYVVLQAGDTVVADGTVLEARFLEVDEALLTGESDPVRRQAGDRLLSGSVCVAGEGVYCAENVGRAAFAQSISSAARRYHYSASPMTHAINRIIEILTATAVGLCALYFLFYLLSYFDTGELVRMIAATITSMVPQGLVVTATISFTLGAVVMSRRGAVVQRLNAVEAMASLDVICTDKTGTLTTNRLRLEQLVNLAGEVSADEVRRRLALFAAASVDRTNRNIEALRGALGSPPVELLDQLPFKSQNRYSAVRIRDGGAERVLVLGAPEVIGGGEGKPEVQALLRQGLRVLLFSEVGPDHVAGVSFASTQLPAVLCPLALIALGDELRPEAAEVLRALARQGIALKVISGDNPQTVQATVAALDEALAHEAALSGKELEGSADKAGLVRRHAVFGRVTPRQKVEIVQTLQQQGRRVAMIGDGVNDVLPIKRADLGIALGAGSQAAKAVAGLVLENNNFALLPETLEEGRTILRNLRRATKLFLVKNVYSLVLILAYASGLLDIPFPYLPQQVTLLNWLVIGMPALVIALTRERSQAAARPRFLREVGGFALRTGLIFGLAGLTIMALAPLLWNYEPPMQKQLQRTLLLSVLILLGITALLRALRDGEARALTGDTRLRWLAAGVVPIYLLVMYLPLAAEFFRLTPLHLEQWLLVLAVAGPAYLLTQLSDLSISRPRKGKVLHP
jgi:cation-transporting ATPase E